MSIMMCMSVDERECDAVTNRPIREQHFIDHAPTQQRGVVHGGAHGVKKWGRGVVDGANTKWWQSKKKGKEGGKKMVVYSWSVQARSQLVGKLGPKWPSSASILARAGQARQTTKKMEEVSSFVRDGEQRKNGGLILA